MTIKEAANKLLAREDYKQWNDNYVLSLIDSLDTKDAVSRKYNFQVFKQIMKIAEGFVSEAIGTAALAFVRNHTEEFVNWSEELTRNQFVAWAYYAGTEIALAANNNTQDYTGLLDGNKYAVLLLKNCKTCKPVQTRKLNHFITQMLATVKQVSD